jgi:hypothetical protein
MRPFRASHAPLLLCSALLLAGVASADDLLLCADDALPGRVAVSASLLSAEYLHFFANGYQASGGVSTYSAGPFHRTLALGTALLPLDSRLKLALEAKGGAAGADDYHYTQYEGSAQLIYTLAPSTYIAAGDHYLSDGQASGSLADVSVTQVLARRFTVMAKLLTTASGNLNSNAAYLQADYYGERHWIAGGAVGHANPWLNQFFEDSAGHFSQVFGGLGFDTYGLPITVYLKHYSSASIQQWELALLVKVPLRAGQ